MFTWNGFQSLIPATSLTIAFYSFWQKNMTVTRVLALVIMALQITYNICVHSYPGIVNELLTAAAVVFSLARQKVLDKRAKQQSGGQI